MNLDPSIRRRGGALIVVLGGASAALRGTALHLSHSPGGVTWSRIFEAMSIMLLILAVGLLAITFFRRNR